MDVGLSLLPCLTSPLRVGRVLDPQQNQLPTKLARRWSKLPSLLLIQCYAALVIFQLHVIIVFPDMWLTLWKPKKNGFISVG